MTIQDWDFLVEASQTVMMYALSSDVLWASGNMHEIDIAYYETNCVIYGYHVYKSVWLVVLGEQQYT